MNPTLRLSVSNTRLMMFISHIRLGLLSIAVLLTLTVIVGCDSQSDEPRTVVEGIAVASATGEPLSNISVQLFGVGGAVVSIPFALDTTQTDGRFRIATDSRRDGEVRVDAVDRRLSGPGQVRYYYSPTNLPQYVRMGRRSEVRIEFVLVDREAAGGGEADARLPVGR